MPLKTKSSQGLYIKIFYIRSKIIHILCLKIVVHGQYSIFSATFKYYKTVI